MKARITKIWSAIPQIGMIENRERWIRGFAITEQVSIFYRIEKEVVIIVNFFDNRENPDTKSHVWQSQIDDFKSLCAYKFYLCTYVF